MLPKILSAKSSVTSNDIQHYPAGNATSDYYFAFAKQTRNLTKIQKKKTFKSVTKTKNKFLKIAHLESTTNGSIGEPKYPRVVFEISQDESKFLASHTHFCG